MSENKNIYWIRLMTDYIFKKNSKLEDSNRKFPKWCTQRNRTPKKWTTARGLTYV